MANQHLEKKKGSHKTSCKNKHSHEADETAEFF
jgi:hypothetical protein